MSKIFIQILLFFSSSIFTFSQIVDPFSIRYQANQKGGIRLLSNVSISCNNCTATSQVPPTGFGDNNSFFLSNINVDTDLTTFNSSSDKLALANCSEISWAGLYWVGQVGWNTSSVANYASRNQVRIKVNTGAYQTLVADELLDNTTGKYTYHCFKDVTALVQGSPIDARYTVANVVAEQDFNSFGAWTMVVVYKNVYEPMKNLTVFDGLANVTAGTGSIDIPISGFLTPPTGPVSFELGVIAHDGDRGQTGDKLLFNGAGTYVNISDAIHNVNDVFNSTISRNGTLTPLRLPNYNNTLGHDANIFSPINTALNYIGNNASAATIRISTVSETLLSSVLTSAIDIYEPDLRSSVTYVDLNGGTVEPGDVIEYKIVSKNIGSDVSLGTILTDTLDQRLTFVPGSINIVSGPNSGFKSDAFDTDQAEYDAVNKVIIARIGTGANGTTGGQVVNSSTGADSTVLKFQVTLNNDCLLWQCGSVLENKAYLSGTGQISGILNNNGGQSDVLDANGCPSNQNGILTVNTSNCVDTLITHNDSLCVGDLFQMSFPLSPFLTYQWTGPNGFSSTINNPSIPSVILADSGIYYLQVTLDGVQCITDSLAPLFVSANPTIQFNSIHNDSCFGLGLGYIDLLGLGNAPFSYNWSNGDVNPINDTLSAGNYNLLITDTFGCTVSDSYAITEPTLLTNNVSINSNYNGEHISCYGASDGSVLSTVTGGVTPYSYSWSPVSSVTNTVTNLGPGYHIATVTDANGCILADSVLLVEPDSLFITSLNQDVLCFGYSTGDIDISVIGGTLPYTYSWSNSSTNEDLSGIVAGTYSTIVTDINGCSKSATYTITEPTDSMTITFSQTNVLCFGASTGSIDVTVINGNPTYSYLWNTGDITQDLAGILSGNYMLTVTDNNGCQQSISVTITQPLSPISLTNTPTDNLCFGDSTGLIDLSVTGGTPNYTYNWSNGDIAQDIDSLPSGSYTVTVTDDNSCIDTATINVVQPLDLTLSAAITDILCYNFSTGAIDLTITGGTTNYSYQWTNSAITQDITGLQNGIYSVVVTDANGCIDSLSSIVTQPIDSMTITYVKTDVLCFSNSTGNIDVSVANGVAPLSYSWNNGALTEDISNLLAGTYDLTVTDANGCSQTISVTIVEPPLLTHTPTAINPSCIGGVQGSISILVSGGTPGYSYLWNNSQTTPAMTNLNAGTYTCVITDTNGCIENVSISLTDPAALVVTETHTDISCFGGADGTIDLNVTGGTPGYTYQWSNTQTIQDLTALSAGNYFVDVYDANNCGVFLSVILTEPIAPMSVADTTIVDNLCFSYSNGSIDIEVSGGTGPYNYLWSNGSTNQDIQNLTAGSFSLTVTDANSCVLNYSGVIAQPTEVIMTESHIDILCNGESTGSIDLSTNGGVSPYTYSWSNGPTTEDLTNVIAGIYTVIATDSNSCYDTLSIILIEPLMPISITDTVTNVSCFGGSDGSIDISVTGGTPIYQYAWTTSAITEDISTLPIGTYTVIVTDDHGCQDSISRTITQPNAPLSLSTTMTAVLCNGGNTGTATVIASGGTSGYTYLWNNSATTSLISNLPTGSYSVIVTDTNGCIAYDTIQVTEPILLSGQISHTNVLCYGNSTGQASVLIAGGVLPYTYLWNNAASTATNSNLPSGQYSVVITDSNSCNITLFDTILQPIAPIDISFTSVNNLCFGDTLGAVDATITGGTIPYTFAWNSGQVSEDIINLSIGMYVLTVTDFNNCQLTDSISITEPNIIDSINVLISDVSCFGGNNGSIDLSVIGGVTPYSYSWDDPSNSTSQDVNNLPIGQYTVAVTDSNSCSRSFSYTVTEPLILAATAVLVEPTCFGYNDGSIAVNVTGGVTPYTFGWSNGTSLATAVNLATGNYSVIVTDANQCSFSIDTVLNEPAQFNVSFVANDTVGCDPFTVDFTNTSDYQFSCTWDFGDGQTETGCNPSHTYLTTGCHSITLTVQSALGCTNSFMDANYICVNPTPTAIIDADPKKIFTNSTEITISNQSLGGSTYVWDLGDGTSGMTYFEPGLYSYPNFFLDNYLISLLVISDKGCRDSTTLNVSADNEIVVYVPNAFTPNGDENNNVFLPIVPEGMDGYELEMYNRWGELVFRSFDSSIGWDGTHQGKLSPTGTYIWVLRLKSSQKDNPIIKKGHVILLE